jgi:hypothetical protein
MSAWSELRPIDLRNRIEIAETMMKFAPRESDTGKSALLEQKRLTQERMQTWRSQLYRALLAPAHIATINETGSNYIPFREIAHARCLRVLNALQRRSGATSDLAKLGLPASATIDPFTEEPLRIIRTKTGWVVYSLGEVQKDMVAEGESGGNYVVGNVHELPHRKK